MSRQRMPITIRGVTYPDAHAAGKALGVSYQTVYCAVCRGNIERVGLGIDYRNRRVKGGKPPKPVIIAGRRFASIAALARALGREPRNVRISLKAGDVAKGRIVLAVLKMIAAEEKSEAKRREVMQDD